MAIMAILAITATMAILAITFRNVGADKLLKAHNPNSAKPSRTKSGKTVISRAITLTIFDQMLH